MHRFVIMRNGELETYTQWEDIPQVFEHVIEFAPTMPEPPHTEQQHQEMGQWNTRLQELVKRERDDASSNKNR